MLSKKAPTLIQDYPSTSCSRRVITRVLLALLACNPWACSETALTAPEPSVCTTDTCPEGWCKLTINFSDDCTDVFSSAEVLIGESLEPASATVGTPFTSVADIPQGTTTPVWVRAEGWQWRIEITCSDPDNDGDFTLSCNSAE